MAHGRRLSSEEAQLWRRVIATVEPLRKGQAVVHDPAPVSAARHPPAGSKRLPETPPAAQPGPAIKPASKAPPALRQPGWTLVEAPPPVVGGALDGSWEKRLSRGQLMPEVTVDLHGHSLDSAHRYLDEALTRAISGGLRTILLITGKARAPGSGRGAIRAAVADWLAASRHAAHIAAVRGAHPRHGGDGALYIVLRRRR